VTQTIQDVISHIVAKEQAISTESLVRKVVNSIPAEESEVRSMIVRMTLARRIRLTSGWRIRPVQDHAQP